jgi:hypothetical protein
MALTVCRFAFLLGAISTALAAQSIPQPTSASSAATRDSSYIDAEGTAYVTRIVPVPPDLSPEARSFLIRRVPDQGPAESLEQRRAQMEISAARAQSAWTKLCPNTIADSTLAGVPVRIITPSNLSGGSGHKVSSTCTEAALMPTRARFPRRFPSPATRESK